MGRIRLAVGLVAAAGAVILAPGAAAGTPADEELRVVSIDRSNLPRVEVVLAVPPTLSGRTLPPAAFTVEYGKETLPSEAERLDTNTLELVIVVDTSAAMTDVLHAIQGALPELPVHLPEPRFAIVTTREPARVALPLTTDQQTVTQTLQSLTTGGTGSVGDGLALAFAEFSDGADVRRAVVLVTADPNAGSRAVDDAAVRARVEDVTVYAIHLGDEAPHGLAALAGAAGGDLTVLPDASGIVPALDEIVAHLRGQYRVEFDVDGRDDTEPVSVVLRADGITARAPVPISLVHGGLPEAALPQAAAGATGRPAESGPNVPLIAAAAGLVVVVAAGQFLTSRVLAIRADQRGSASGV